MAITSDCCVVNELLEAVEPVEDVAGCRTIELCIDLAHSLGQLAS